MNVLNFNLRQTLPCLLSLDVIHDPFKNMNLALNGYVQIFQILFLPKSIDRKRVRVFFKIPHLLYNHLLTAFKLLFLPRVSVENMDSYQLVVCLWI